MHNKIKVPEMYKYIARFLPKKNKLVSKVRIVESFVILDILFLLYFLAQSYKWSRLMYLKK